MLPAREAITGPLLPLLGDAGVVEVAIDPDGRVWYERQGAPHMGRAEGMSLTAEAASNLAGTIASEVGSAVSEKKPLVSGKIVVSGHALRAQVVTAPVVEGGPSITLRAYTQRRIELGKMELLHGELKDLEAERHLHAARIAEMAGAGDVAGAMAASVERRLNVVVSGGTSTGKTTFARELLDLVHPGSGSSPSRTPSSCSPNSRTPSASGRAATAPGRPRRRSL